MTQPWPTALDWFSQLFLIYTPPFTLWFHQPWLAGKSPNWMEVSMGNHWEMVHFPAHHVWWHRRVSGIFHFAVWNHQTVSSRGSVRDRMGYGITTQMEWNKSNHAGYLEMLEHGGFLDSKLWSAMAETTYSKTLRLGECWRKFCLT